MAFGIICIVYIELRETKQIKGYLFDVEREKRILLLFDPIKTVTQATTTTTNYCPQLPRPLFPRAK